MLVARRIPLGEGPPKYTVKYATEAIRELAARPDAEALMDELEATLGRDPIRPPGRRAKALTDWRPLRRYRPHIDNDLRVFDAVEGDEVWVLGLHPRSTEYRRKDLKAALGRLERKD